MNYFKQDKPFVIPTTDGKLIEEHFGLATGGDSKLSIAHMLAPAGWSEPFQNPSFDEYTLVSRGKKLFEVDGETVTAAAITAQPQVNANARGTIFKSEEPFRQFIGCSQWGKHNSVQTGKTGEFCFNRQHSGGKPDGKKGRLFQGCQELPSAEG